MRRVVPIYNRTIDQLAQEEGVISVLRRLKCNDKLSFIGEQVKIGDKTLIYYFCNLFGKSEIGENCIIGSFVEIQGDVIVGNSCRIGSHSFLCSGVTLEDSVFLGSHVVTINDRLPKSHNNTYKQEKTVIKKGASIGSGSVLMCGITIGENSVIGAKSLVLKDIPPNEIWAGHPTKFIRKV